MKEIGVRFRNYKPGFTPLQILKDSLLIICKLRSKDSDRLIDSHKKFVTGFTLTELLIVIIIISIVATLALPMLVKTIEKAKLGEAASNLNLIRTGQKIYFLEYGQFSPTITDLNIENPNTPSNRYFDYTEEVTDPDLLKNDFTARAQRRNNAPNPYSTYYYEISKDGAISSLPAGNPLKP